ncbi:unannotated protein [freshwater metagenome]|uniref:Unannotated protein n=1 Tax=freshwater metagenome TaxID=449393 RepID=A0A6J6DZ73_9ZZZZ
MPTPGDELSTENLNTSLADIGDAVGSKDMVKPELLTSVKVTPVVAGIEKFGDPAETTTTIEFTELTKLRLVEEEIPNPLKVRVLS